jgi:hypothetical protein
MNFDRCNTALLLPRDDGPKSGDSEWRVLLAATGFELVKAVKTSGAFDLVEARPVRGANSTATRATSDPCGSRASNAR